MAATGTLPPSQRTAPICGPPSTGARPAPEGVVSRLATNLKCLCRKHHLLKTFWTGWRDKQFPDGTLEWTSPSGRTYITHPGSRLLFPALCLPTGALPTPTITPERSAHRALMMPTRRRTRAQDRARRIDTERAQPY
ncbi:hypothetical protein MSAS_39430 [Mycobacterium saskatchewanense]|nr:hypothetical protein MSAS_39430 [Mycobacterium saskatchewanense]